jgi:hypothetical protein
MKKLVIVALAAFSFLATAKSTKNDLPIPECNPCPWVR